MENIEMAWRLLAQRQHGALARSQLLALGLSAKQIERRVANGELNGDHRGVFRLAGAPETFEQRTMLACLASRGVASHRCAAALWDFRRSERGLVEVTVDGRRAPRLRGVVAHTTSRLERVDTTTLGSIPLTTPARTLLDLGATVPGNVVLSAAEGAMHRGQVSYDWLQRTMRRTAASGRDGSGVLRAVLASRSAGDVATESVLEDDLVALLLRAGLPAPIRQFVIRVPGFPEFRLDVSYPPDRVALEGQSVAWHTGRDALQRDCEKRNLLVALGWRLLVFTWDDIHYRPDTVVSAVSAARHR